MKINLHIERLVLDGLAVEPQQRAALKAALEAELAGSLAQSGIASGLQGGGSFAAVRAAAINVGERNEPAQLGQQIAQSIHGGISR
jgi:hypothetical protein